FTKDTKVRLCDGRDLSFEELIKEQEKGKKHWTFTFNPEAKKIEITEIKNPRLTRKKEKIIEITLDNNEKIRCTLNHRFMIRDGAYREAQDLKQGDSLMPLYTELFNGEDKNLKGYETVFQPIKNEREFVHHLADEWNLEHAVYGKSAGRIRHHSDFNKLNNNPDNILRIQWQDHWRYHREIASERHKNDLEYVKKIAEGRKKYIENNRQVFSLRAINLNKKLWASAEFRKKHSERIKKMWQNPVYKEYMREASSKNLKKLWRREDFQKLLSALKSEEMKKRWENEEYRVSKIQEMRVVSLKMWSDPKYREHMSKLMTERFLNPELRKKQSRISKKLWQNAEYRQKTLKMIKEAWQSPERRAKYEKDYFSNMAKKLWQNPATRQFHHEKMLRQRENQEFLNKNKEGLRKLYIRRIKENPNYIDELTEKAKVALNKNWQDPLYKKRVMKSKILRYVFNLSRGYSKITPKIYEKERINNGVPALRNALNYFSNFEEIIEQAPKYNHKVIRVKILKKREDVYDLTVDPWHNFALAAGIFVHNSIDDPGEFAAMRYCITGDSLAVTNRCVEKISTISDKEDVSLNVLSFGKKINPASKWFDSGIHPVLEIKTFRNYSLKGTYNHPILTITNGSQGRPVFKWKLLENIEKGDYAVIDRSEALWPSKEPDLKKYHPMGGKENKNSHPKIYKLPSRMTPDLAFLLGAILAEGYVSRGKQRGNYKIGFCNTNKEFNDEFRGKFKKLFPECSPYELERKPVGYGKKNFLSFEICSKRLVEFFENLGLKGVASQEKRVPEPIFHSTKKSVGEFLKGYFEGDGGVFRNINSFWVEGSSSSEGLIKEIQTILLRFGIVSSACPNLKRGEFKLLIRGFKNLDNFNNKIGFLTEEKKKKLSEYSQINSDGRIMPKTDFIPFLSQYLRKKYANNKGVNCSSRRWILTHNLDRYLKLQKYCKKLEKILDEPDLQLVESFIDNNYLFDQVVAVEKREAEKVYSLRVDSPCHSFVANGFINHNTECRMSKIGEEMLKDTEKDTVNFTENYDGTRKEPTVLPSPLPQLLLNGSLGIAVGMATNIPPHNLSEVVDGLVYLIDNQKADTEDLFKFIKGPDFPLGGEIFDQKEIILAYSQGKGPILTRAKTEIVEQEKGARRQIIVSEIPFQVQKSVLLEHIAELVQEKKIEGIKDIRDESDKEGM
ncbi:MAG: DNA gyrase subunit A, partial [Candidatus Wildermuthbacteria bacterium]|nr:DNA gyrase subunit A [Candidatus Wildermuthbacteria bacterium]